MTPDQSAHLLVVEDEPHLAHGLTRNLELDGFGVVCVSTGEDGLAELAGAPHAFDLVVLDIMLPGIDGLEVCRRVRAAGNTIPILFLTARGSDADRVLGLQTGADDYLTKPFVFDELVLRIRGIIRRSSWQRTAPETGPEITIGASVVDLQAMRASTPNGTVDLTERELMLIRFFAENEDRVLPRGEFLERVWGYTFDTATRTLDTFIHRLRKHFEPDPQHPCHFHTVRGVGYRFTSEAE